MIAPHIGAAMPRTVLWSMIRQDARPSEPERSRARCRSMRAAKCCWQMAPVDGAGQLRATGMERCTRQRRAGRRRSMQTLRAIVTHKRSARRSMQSPSGTVRANAQRIRSTYSLNTVLRANARHNRSPTRWNSRAGPHGEGVFATNAGFLANFVDFWRCASTVLRLGDLVGHIRTPLLTLFACFYS